MKPAKDEPIYYFECFLAILLGGLWIIFPGESEIIFFSMYMMFSTSFLAIAHESLLLSMGVRYGPLAAILLAIMPTITGCYFDNQVIKPLARFKIIIKMRTSSLYRRVDHYFQINPFMTILIFALTPLPFYPVRLLSIFSDNPADHYMLAGLIGRIPRLFLIASGAFIFAPAKKIILFIFILMIIFYILSLLHKLYQSRHSLDYL